MVRVGDGQHVAMATYVARRLRESAPAFVHDFLGLDSWLVPVPRSGLIRRGALWPAFELAHGLAEIGLGAGVADCLQRVVAVPKAATSSAEERPKARTHFESLSLSNHLTLPGGKICLIDDVVTRGAQLFGAAWRVWQIRPDADVRAFAVVRTISSPEEFTSIADPCVGTIQLRGELTRRRP